MAWAIENVRFTLSNVKISLRQNFRASSNEQRFLGGNA